MSGWVYLIQAGEHTKIGIATNVQARMAALQTGHPQTLELRGTFECADPRRVEMELHELFRPKHVRGEWFALTDADITQALNCLKSTPKREPDSLGFLASAIGICQENGIAVRYTTTKNGDLALIIPGAEWGGNGPQMKEANG